MFCTIKLRSPRRPNQQMTTAGRVDFPASLGT